MVRVERLVGVEVATATKAPAAETKAAGEEKEVSTEAKEELVGQVVAVVVVEQSRRSWLARGAKGDYLR